MKHGPPAPFMLDYQIRGSSHTMVITHTDVPATVGGQSIAAVLIHHTMAHARMAAAGKRMLSGRAKIRL